MPVIPPSGKLGREFKLSLDNLTRPCLKNTRPLGPSVLSQLFLACLHLARLSLCPTIQARLRILGGQAVPRPTPLTSAFPPHVTHWAQEEHRAGDYVPHAQLSQEGTDKQHGSWWQEQNTGDPSLETRFELWSEQGRAMKCAQVASIQYHFLPHLVKRPKK